LQLRDSLPGRGGFKYRIYAGAIPYLDSIFPLGGRRGQSVEVELQGHNLASLTITNKIDPNTQLGVQKSGLKELIYCRIQELSKSATCRVH